MRRPEIGQKDGVDLVGQQAGTFEQPRFQRRRGEAGIDEDILPAHTHERRRAVRRSNDGGFIPKPVAAKRPDADDVDPKR